MADLIEVRRRILTQTPHLETASGQIAAFNTSLTAPIKSLHVDLEPMQSGSGDPSPTNVRPITGSTSVTVQVLDKSGNSTATPVSWESQAGTVYGGYVDLVSGELVVNRGFVTLDGNAIKFSGMYTDADRYRVYTPARGIPGLMYGSNKDAKPLASNMLGKPNGTTTDLNYTPPFICAGGYNAQFYVALPLSLGFSSVADANTWLSTNPIQVSYLLMNEQRYQLSPQQIKAFRGNNCILADNKNMTVRYWTNYKYPTVNVLVLSSFNLTATNNSYTQVNANSYSPGDVITATVLSTDATVIPTRYKNGYFDFSTPTLEFDKYYYFSADVNVLENKLGTDVVGIASVGVDSTEVIGEIKNGKILICFKFIKKSGSNDKYLEFHLGGKSMELQNIRIIEV